ncbi:MAG: polysaccharide deacetylase family protein [Candidatus Krumholzibacteriia bacterium]
MAYHRSSAPSACDIIHETIPRVLAYHKVTGFEFGGTWVSPERFERQIDALLAAGFRFIDETAFLDALDGRRESSGREILLTFDDGYRMLLDRAVPALESRGIPALIFLVSAFAGRRNTWELNLPGRRFVHLGWDEIRDLARRGFAFGSHARTHRDLTRLSLKDLRVELADSKREIESRLAASVRSFSYPFGRLNDRVRREAERAGYRAAFTLYPPRSARPDRYVLRREGIYVIDSIGNIKAKLGTGLPFLFEDFKGRMINAFAVLTPLFKDGFRRANTTSRRPRVDS